MENKILIPASLDSYGSRADGSIRLSFSTGIVNNDQLLVINAIKSQSGFLMFKDAGISKDEESLIDSVDVDLDNSKTPSQRLRNSLYVAWSQNSEGLNEFKEYYRTKMEKFINHVKSKLD
jgi:hypothetical protein